MFLGGELARTGYRPETDETERPVYQRQAYRVPVSQYATPAAPRPGDSNYGTYMDRYGQLQGSGMLINATLEAGDTLTAAYQMYLQSQAIREEASIQREAMEHADTARREELGFREDALESQERMQEAQIGHEQALARIEQQTQVRLARVAENGKIERTEIIAANDLLGRRTPYVSGSPAISFRI